MLDFLIRSSFSLLVFLVVYHVFLEREKMHVFSRFYLIGTLFFSLCVPFVSLDLISANEYAGQVFSGRLQPMQIKATGRENLEWIGLIYSVGLLLFFVRFVRNLSGIYRRISSNRKIGFMGATLVVTSEKILPHTFLNYIFLNEEDHDRNRLQNELYTHELIHVRQKHTVDILLIEILQMLFWFNPLFFYYKKAIQMNHEFLADAGVLDSYDNVPNYQNLLLSIATGKTNCLASNINYSLTKKRFVMMTKSTSKFTATLKKVAVFPVIAVVALISCEKAKPIEKEDEVEIRFANYYEDKDSAFAKKSGDLTAEVVTENDGHFKNPEFPGGIPEFQNYLVKNLSEIAGKDAKLIVRFIVEKDGSVADVKVAKYNGPDVDKIKEVLLNSPKWTAAIYNGEAVPFLYTLPIQM